MMEWLFQNWRELVPFPWSSVALAFVAVLCGGIVGSEREKREKPAGMRTLMLVTLGSAVFTMISFAFVSTTGDSGRVSAQIVTGIGFLGAGVIMRGRGIVSGTTTAATIWTTAAIGMVAGAGYAGGAVGLSVLVRAVLGGAFMWELNLRKKLPPVHVKIDFDPDHGKTKILLERILMEFGVHPYETRWTSAEGGNSLERLSMDLHLPKHHVAEMLAEIAAKSAVKSMKSSPLATGE